jgi:DNA-binding MarR family transcriptional regulator
MTWEEGLIAVARDREVTGEMLRVLLVILAKRETSESTNLSQAEIAGILFMKRQNVSAAINRLVAKGIIKKRTEGGKLVGYRVEEYFGFES